LSPGQLFALEEEEREGREGREEEEEEEEVGPEANVSAEANNEAFEDPGGP
jgi:hypothetical protein